MAYPSTSGMVQASSSLHGSMRRDPEGYDMSSDLDQALLLYFDGQQAKTSIQEQQPQTLNIFPSQPMHHIEPSPKGSMASSSAAVAQVAGPSKNSQAPSLKVGGGPLAAGKSSKAAIKREGSAARGKHGAAGASSSDEEGPRTPDPKTLRRLAQNREAARKSRLRKKAYIQQLESGRIKLAQLEQEMQMTITHQGALWGAGTLSPDAALFNLEYERWLGEHSKVVARLRAAAEEHRPDGELRAYVDEAAAHYGALMGHKARVAGADPLHLLSGLWKGAAERCFLWIGGFRPSELVKVVVRHVEPLAEQQAAGARDVEQAARRVEEALDAELDALLRSLSEVVASDAPPPPGMMYGGGQLYHPADVAAGYMGMGHMHVALAMDKVASLGTILRQADELRMQALHALRQILTARQAARCFIAAADYFCRLRTLSTLWTTSRTGQLARGPAG
ncbi:transcription factor TGAL8-like isoform X1 [Miscanthus floridulus]|uniref:transcription factor TGAL8-like isoform X1 n=2 Tax=Miscanthus floridulus TaxID=154761 RepID=UPI003459EA82